MQHDAKDLPLDQIFQRLDAFLDARFFLLLDLAILRDKETPTAQKYLAGLKYFKLHNRITSYPFELARLTLQEMAGAAGVEQIAGPIDSLTEDQCLTLMAALVRRMERIRAARRRHDEGPGGKPAKKG